MGNLGDGWPTSYKIEYNDYCMFLNDYFFKNIKIICIIHALIASFMS